MTIEYIADVDVGKVVSEPSWALFGFGRVSDKKVIQKLKIRDRPTAAKLIEVLESNPPKDARTATQWFKFLADKGGKQFIETGFTVLANHVSSFLSRRFCEDCWPQDRSCSKVSIRAATVRDGVTSRLFPEVEIRSRRPGKSLLSATIQVCRLWAKREFFPASLRCQGSP